VRCSISTRLPQYSTSTSAYDIYICLFILAQHLNLLHYPQQTGSNIPVEPPDNRSASSAGTLFIISCFCSYSRLLNTLPTTIEEVLYYCCLCFICIVCIKLFVAGRFRRRRKKRRRSACRLRKLRTPRVRKRLRRS
jgi:hypothetical protein